MTIEVARPYLFLLLGPIFFFLDPNFVIGDSKNHLVCQPADLTSLPNSLLSARETQTQSVQRTENPVSSLT